MRSHADVCAVAVTSRQWRKKRVATPTAAPSPRPRSRHGGPVTWRQHNRPSQRWQHSSECVSYLIIVGFIIFVFLIDYQKIANSFSPILQPNIRTKNESYYNYNLPILLSQRLFYHLLTRLNDWSFGITVCFSITVCECTVQLYVCICLSVRVYLNMHASEYTLILASVCV